MPSVDTALNQETLDSLRITRRKLYAIPDSELNSMSLDDQVKYGDSLHQVGLAILKLEAAKLKGVNDQFKEKEGELKSAAANLEMNTAALEDAIKIVRVTSEGINLITKIIELLA